MSRHWLFTSTFYGNWLPGDPRGFVTRVRDQRPDDPDSFARFVHDAPGTPYDHDLPGLWRSAANLLKGRPIRLQPRQAEVLAAQFRETASHRGWSLLALAVMANHVHLVVEVAENPAPVKVLADFKAYGSRALSRASGKPPYGNWWTEGGSKRKLSDDRAVAAAIEYVLRRQRHTLVLWPDSSQPPGEREGVSPPSD